jgi:DNA-binding MarR family transcriptional regulator
MTFLVKSNLGKRYAVRMTKNGAFPPLAGEDLETWSAVATVLEWLPVALDAQLQRDAQLTHFEYGVLYALAHAEEGRLRMSVLSSYANSTLSRLSRAATRLEAKGWMRRTPDPADGRFTLALITESGRAKVDEAAPGHAELVRELVLDRLTAAQRRQLREISRRIAGGLREEGGWRPSSSDQV